jgi:cellulose synthase/poly-beta-1,6-N-acetylglucosamine synthase-like glycosyltransferase
MVSMMLTFIFIALQSYVILYLVYLWTPAIAACVASCREKIRRAPVVCRRRFVIMLSAHNEEAVIGSLLDSLAAQRYPSDRYQVHIVANNCTDRTAAIVQASDLAVCHERLDGDLATKGAALSWLWQRVSAETTAGDVVLILDADNVVAPDFLDEMNQLFERGCRVVQSTRRAKNADDSWASQLDGISEALWNRLDQEGRMFLGLSATLAGSGMAFEREVFAWLMRDGAPGLLEDIEWQARLMLAKITVGYASRASVFDEKTSDISQVSRQRKRWVAGAAVAARQYGWPLLLESIMSRDIRLAIAAFGVTKPPRSILFALLGLLLALAIAVPGTPGLLPWMWWMAMLGSIGLYIMLGMLLNRSRPRAYLALLLAPAFALLVIGAAIMGSLRPSRQRWIPTTHARAITIDQVARD